MQGLNGGDTPTPPDKQKPNNSGFSFRNNRFALIFLLAIIGMFAVLLFSEGGNSNANLIPYSQFLGYLEDGRVESVRILDQYEIRGQLKGNGEEALQFRTHIPYFDDSLVDLLRERGIRFSGSPRSVSPFRVFLDFLPWIIGFFFIWFMFQRIQGSGNRAFSFGRSRVKQVTESAKKITFEDVAGQIEAKYELQEVVEFLKDPDRFIKIGARIPKGVLLIGMPGTGKTLLARASAGEASVNFFHMSGSDFVEMFVGVGASRVRDLFEQGRKNAPCIIFIDELDAVGRTRGAGYGGGHDEREQTLNQMLVEMDGFDTKEGVIILAATNRPDVLDPALLRPGRFDRQVVIDMPDLEERRAILKLHMRKIPTASDVDLRRLARATPGCSGADLANLVNEAALLTARKDKKSVDMDDFEEARDKILMGAARKSKVLTEEEREKTAYHESGHALLHYYCPHSDPLHKVTIIPRGRALGLAISLPEKEIFSRGRKWLLDRIKICYGGFVAEEIFYSETSTGTQNDLQQATSIARKMVTEWGMSNLGAISLGQEDEPIFLGKEIARHKDYSEQTAQMIDAEIERILSEAMEDVRTILKKHKKKLVTLSKALIKRETLTDTDIRELLGFPPADESPNGEQA